MRIGYMYVVPHGCFVKGLTHAPLHFDQVPALARRCLRWTMPEARISDAMHNVVTTLVQNWEMTKDLFGLDLDDVAWNAVNMR